MKISPDDADIADAYDTAQQSAEEAAWETGKSDEGGQVEAHGQTTGTLTRRIFETVGEGSTKDRETEKGGRRYGKVGTEIQ